MLYKYLFTGTLLLYLVSASGRLAIIDCLVYFQVAKSIALQDWINVSDCVPNPSDNHCVPGIDGKNYSGLGLLPSLIAAPLLRPVYTVFGFGGMADRIAETLASLINPFVSAASVCLFAYWLRRLGFLDSVAICTSLLFGFATPLWQFSTKGFWSEPLYVFGLMLSLAAGCQANSRGRIWAGVGLGIAILSRSIGVLFTPIFVIYCLAAASTADRRKLRTYFELGTPILLALSFILLTNDLRFGSPFKTGYHTKFPNFDRLFSTPLYEGLSGLLLDPEVGILWFMPWLLCLPWIVRVGWRKYPKELALVVAFFLTNLLVFAKYTDWAGGLWPIGPRMLLAGAVLPAFALSLPLERLLSDFSKPRWLDLVLLVLVLWSFSAQVLSAIYPVSRFQNRVVYQERIGEPLRGFQRNRLIGSWVDLSQLHWREEGIEQQIGFDKDNPVKVQKKYKELMLKMTKSTSFERYLQQLPTSVNQLAPDLLFSKLAIFLRRPWLCYGAALALILASLWLLSASLRSSLSSSLSPSSRSNPRSNFSAEASG